MIFSCSRFQKNIKKYFNKDLIKRFANTYEICDGNINKFILLLSKELYQYEYLDSWEIFNEKTLPEQKVTFSNLNMGKKITNADYKHTKKA